MSIIARSFAVAMATAGIVSAAGAAEIHAFKINNWKAGAYTNDQTGAFSHCAARADYKSGVTLLFVVTKDYDWAMAFSHNKWNLNVGDSFPIRYQIDRGRIRDATANVIGKSLVRASLPDSTDLFDDFRRGTNLAVQGGSEVLNFRLTDTSAMLSAVLGCARDFRARMASAPAPSLAPSAPSLAPAAPALAPSAPSIPSFEPQRDVTSNNEGIINRGAAPEAAPNNQGTFFNFNPPAAGNERPTPLQPQAFNSAPAPAGRATPGATPGPSGEARIEAGNVAVNVLNRAGIGNYRMLSVADAPASVKNHDAVWSANGMLGTLRIFPANSGLGPDRIRGDLLSSDATACKGRFASGVAPDPERPNAINLFTQCDGDKGFSAFYLVMPRGSGGHYLISLVTAPDKDQDLRAASTAYRNAAAQVMP